MAVYKISDNYFEHSYSLIALHTAIEDYRLAYLLNTHLCMQLRKLPDIDCIEEGALFSLYGWEDQKENTVWSLVSNRSQPTLTNPSQPISLFKMAVPTVSYLLPEQKQVDYFLKIEEAPPAIITAILERIIQLPQLLTAYTVEPDELKSKKNLIF